MGALKLTDGPIRLVMGLRRNQPWGLLWLAAVLLVLASALIVLPIRRLWRWRRSRRSGTSGVNGVSGSTTTAGMTHKMLAHLALVLVAIAALVFTAGLTRVVLQLADSDYGAVIMAGLPSGAAWLFLLSKAAALLTCTALVSAGFAWRRAPWSRLERIYYAFTAAGAVAFVVFLGVFDLW